MNTRSFGLRRAARRDRRVVADLWLALHTEVEQLDPRLTLAEEALVRFENDFPHWVDAETRRLIVAEQDVGVVGFACAQLWAPVPIYEAAKEVYLDDLYVRREYRRLGIGTQLVAAIREWARDCGAARVRLGAPSRSKESIDFWRAMRAVDLYSVMTIELEGGDT